MSLNEKIILFGGSFDPIHAGHLRVAQHTLSALAADELIFIPARRSPHKSDLPVAGAHRLAMIEKAIEGLDCFSVSDCELLRPEPSYTLDTVRFFRDRLGSDVVLHWLIGADQLTDLHRWYCIGDLLDECRISVMVRAGYPLPDFKSFAGVFPPACIEQLKGDIVQTPFVNLNSTAIRGELAAGAISPELLPAGVLEYIQSHGLYGINGR